MPTKILNKLLILFVVIGAFACRSSVSGKFISVSEIINGNTILLKDQSVIVLLGIYDSKEGFEYLKSNVMGKNVAVFFDRKGKSPSSARQKVYYAYVLGEDRICLNSYMLKSGLAAFCGDYLADSLNKYLTYFRQIAKVQPEPAKPASETNPDNNIKNEAGSTTIKMSKRNGVYEVPIEINGIPMNFIFDTGASSISISSTQVEIMLENGKLSKSDFVRHSDFVDATGRVTRCPIYRLRQVRIGNKTINDIEAAVAESGDAPLLLGQSALARFGKITIDYNNQTIHLEN